MNAGMFDLSARASGVDVDVDVDVERAVAILVQNRLTE